MLEVLHQKKRINKARTTIPTDNDKTVIVGNL